MRHPLNAIKEVCTETCCNVPTDENRNVPKTQRDEWNKVQAALRCTLVLAGSETRSRTLTGQYRNAANLDLVEVQRCTSKRSTAAPTARVSRPPRKLQVLVKPTVDFSLTCVTVHRVHAQTRGCDVTKGTD